MHLCLLCIFTFLFMLMLDDCLATNSIYPFWTDVIQTSTKKWKPEEEKSHIMSTIVSQFIFSLSMDFPLEWQNVTLANKHLTLQRPDKQSKLQRTPADKDWLMCRLMWPHGFCSKINWNTPQRHQGRAALSATFITLNLFRHRLGMQTESVLKKSWLELDFAGLHHLETFIASMTTVYISSLLVRYLLWEVWGWPGCMLSFQGWHLFTY